MHELGLGVPRNYTLALMHYDRARQNARAGTVVTDHNQGLDGTPVELLIFLAKIRSVRVNCRKKRVTASSRDEEEHGFIAADGLRANYL